MYFFRNIVKTLIKKYILQQWNITLVTAYMLWTHFPKILWDLFIWEIIQRIICVDIMLGYILLLSLMMQSIESQYDVVRLDPFRHVSHTLHVYNQITCNWDTLTLQCPNQTKVIITNRKTLVLNSFISSILYMSLRLGKLNFNEMK